MAPGDQACQAIHAALAFANEHHDVFSEWINSEYLVLLSVPDEEALLDELDKIAWKADYKYSVFVEPDFDSEHTAFAAEPAAGKYLSHLPLALREVNING